MKTKEYVKKYKLDESDKFNHSEFVSDLTIDFLTLLEVGKAQENIKGFDNAVRAIRMKFDAVNNKTVGCIPEKLWKYFFATVIAKIREELFPELMKRRADEASERKRIYEERKKWRDQENDFWERAFFHDLLANMFKSIIPEDSFQLLGLAVKSTVNEVKASFRNLVMIHHPDKGGDKNKFSGIVEAKNKCLAYLKSL